MRRCFGVAGVSGKDWFLDILKRRYACKVYDFSRPLAKNDVSFILECARLSPSSFGLEHWHLFAVQNAPARAQLCSACQGQDAVATAPLAVVLACRKGVAYVPDGSFVRERGSRFPGGLPDFLDVYRGYFEFLQTNELLDHWARSQCYIACANMMTGASATGIESCAIEGFDDKQVLAVLNLDPDEWQTGLIVVFGYSAHVDNREKIRMEEGGIITYV